MDASKTIFFIAKIGQIVQIYLGMVLDASKTIFFSAKISQIVRVYLGMVLDAFYVE